MAARSACWAPSGLAVALALVSVAIGLVELAQPILFGRVVDTCRGSVLFSRMVAEGGFTVPQEADS